MLCKELFPVYRNSAIEAPDDTLRNPITAAKVVRNFIFQHGTPDRECLVLVALTSRHTVRALNTVTVGSEGETLFPIAQILRAALLSGSTHFIIGHNHPSGDPTPSPEDLLACKTLSAAAQTVGLRLMDSIIVTDDANVSLLTSNPELFR